MTARRIILIGALLLGAVLIAGTVLGRPLQQENLFQLYLLNIRTDQELLADRVFGGGIRPANWTGNADAESPSILADLWFDNELMADAVFGAGQRPANWISATTRNAELLARNIRHDLELMANAVTGEDIRPPEWVGAPPLNSCDRSVQNIVYLLSTTYNVRPTVSEAVVNYCAAVSADIQDNLIDQTFGSEDLANQLPALVLAVRGDIERLADELLGLNNRPIGWIGNKDVNSETLANDNFEDLELLADEVLGTNQRPPGWSASFTGSPLSTFRIVRRNLELLADATLGRGLENRPRGWQGEDPLFACSSEVQTLVFLIQQNFEFEIPERAAGQFAADYCLDVAREANTFVENPVEITTEEIAADNRFLHRSQRAFAYLDPAALDYMGVMPDGTEFRAWYRNFGESTMMFVSGDNFAVFIDRRWTTMPQEIFDRLPTTEGVRPLTFCDANWCNGPQPTPTPTGSGIILDIISGATPQATVAPNEFGQVFQKQEVSWDHVRVTYVQDNPDAVWVRLEICPLPAEQVQTACEPVVRVLDNVRGVDVPIISDGVFAISIADGYGFKPNLIVEGSTLFAPGLWLTDPSFRAG